MNDLSGVLGDVRGVCLEQAVAVIKVGAVAHRVCLDPRIPLEHFKAPSSHFGWENAGKKEHRIYRHRKREGSCERSWRSAVRRPAADIRAYYSSGRYHGKSSRFISDL